MEIFLSPSSSSFLSIMLLRSSSTKMIWNNVSSALLLILRTRKAPFWERLTWPYQHTSTFTFRFLYWLRELNTEGNFPKLSGWRTKATAARRVDFPLPFLQTERFWYIMLKTILISYLLSKNYCVLGIKSHRCWMGKRSKAFDCDTFNVHFCGSRPTSPFSGKLFDELWLNYSMKWRRSDASN